MNQPQKKQNQDTDFTPFIPANRIIPELTFWPLVIGALLGIVFGASSLYLALKVGMTVSASIPVAVLSITLFKGFSKAFGIRRTTILENNIVQTTGSAGESLAFGVAVTMPALLILGYPMEASRILTVSCLGGVLGILMMIPLRRSLVVDSHKELPFPEGTACAEVLKAGETGGTSAKMVFGGFFLGLIYKFFNVGTKLWTDVPEKAISWFKGATVAAEVSPELLGVGYIIGPRISAIMVAGGILSSWVLIPAIVLFGEGLPAPLFPATKLIRDMSTHEIWKNYVLYIGAGAVAAGGLISLIQTLPTIVSSAVEAFGSLKRSGKNLSKTIRTETDIPLPIVLIGIVGLVAAILFTPQLHINLVGAILIVLAGGLFTTVSSRLTGSIGSSSNPISGMTVATLLITSLIFLMMGWTEIEYRVTALTIAAIVCVASSNGGTTAQDLKTGYLVGGTPRYQQIAIIVGALTSAVVIGYTLILLNNASTIFSKKAVPENTQVTDMTILDTAKTEKVGGKYGETDSNDYYTLYVRNENQKGLNQALPLGKYLVDTQGAVKYLVDPGINGALKTTDDNVAVQKYEAPKARLMSLIIDGILSQALPWGLVLLGVGIALVLELCGVSSLPFVVGVYLPLSSSAPIFVGGMIRLFVDRVLNRKKTQNTENEDEDSSPGVLFSSGLIAGGSIAGILIAIFSAKEQWGQTIDLSGRFPTIAGSNTTAVIAFAVLGFALLSVSRKKKAK